MATALFSPAQKIGLTLDEAARFVRLSVKDFASRVDGGTLPRPRDLLGELRWMRTELEIQPIEGTIYFVGFRDYLKIGFTKNLRNRIAALQTAIPEKLEIYLSFEDSILREREMHELFGDVRLNGEWFRMSDEAREYICIVATYFEGSRLSPKMERPL